MTNPNDGQTFFHLCYGLIGCLRELQTQATPSSLVYGAEAVVPIEILVSSAQLALASKFDDLRERIHDVDAIEERRWKAEQKWLAYQKRISIAYNKRVKARPLKVSDLVLKATGHIQKGSSASKFSPKWEGPYIIREAYNSGYFLISRLDWEGYLAPINGKWLKMYFT